MDAISEQINGIYDALLFYFILFLYIGQHYFI